MYAVAIVFVDVDSRPDRLATLPAGLGPGTTCGLWTPGSASKRDAQSAADPRTSRVASCSRLGASLPSCNDCFCMLTGAKTLSRRALSRCELPAPHCSVRGLESGVSPLPSSIPLPLHRTFQTQTLSEISRGTHRAHPVKTAHSLQLNTLDPQKTACLFWVRSARHATPTLFRQNSDRLPDHFRALPLRGACPCSGDTRTRMLRQRSALVLQHAATHGALDPFTRAPLHKAGPQRRDGQQRARPGWPGSDGSRRGLMTGPGYFCGILCVLRRGMGRHDAPGETEAGRDCAGGGRCAGCAVRSAVSRHKVDVVSASNMQGFEHR